MKIEVSVNNNGNIICTYNNNYVKFSDYIDKISETLDKNYKYKDFKILKKNNGTVSYSWGKNEVTINGFLNNSINSNLDKIIDKAKYIRKDLKIKKHRKQKVERTRNIAGTLVITLGLTGTAYVSKNIDDFKVKAFNDDTNNTYEEIIDYDNNYSSDLAYLNESLEENNKEHYKLDYVDRTGIEDFKTTKSNYSSIIYSIAEEYGIDPQIMLAIATQESIIHREYTGGSAVGLMQIELSAWNEENIIAHNFRTGENETIHITLDKLNDLESNIRIACMIFQNYLIESNYNLEVAIQMYNYGPGNISKTIRACYGNDVDLKELLKNYDNEWLKYRVFINQGDSEYLEHVMSYVEDANDIKCVDLNNNIHSYSFGNYNKTL